VTALNAMNAAPHTSMMKQPTHVPAVQEQHSVVNVPVQKHVTNACQGTTTQKPPTHALPAPVTVRSAVRRTVLHHATPVMVVTTRMRTTTAKHVSVTVLNASMAPAAEPARQAQPSAPQIPAVTTALRTVEPAATMQQGSWHVQSVNQGTSWLQMEPVRDAAAHSQTATPARTVMVTILSLEQSVCHVAQATFCWMTNLPVLPVPSVIVTPALTRLPTAQTAQMAS